MAETPETTERTEDSLGPVWRPRPADGVPAAADIPVNAATGVAYGIVEAELGVNMWDDATWFRMFQEGGMRQMFTALTALLNQFSIADGDPPEWSEMDVQRHINAGNRAEYLAAMLRAYGASAFADRIVPLMAQTQEAIAEMLDQMKVNAEAAARGEAPVVAQTPAAGPDPTETLDPTDPAEAEALKAIAARRAADQTPTAKIVTQAELDADKEAVAKGAPVNPRATTVGSPPSG